MAYDPSRASPVTEPKAQSDITLDALLDEFEVSDPAVRDRVLRLAGVESSGNLNATGPRVNGGMHNGTRARGALQIMPATAKAYPQYDLNDPADASRAGLHYFLDNLNQFGGDLDAATIAHHAGPGTAKKWLREGRAGTVDRATGLSTDDYLLKVAGGKRAKPADKWWEGDPVAPTEAAGNWWESDPVEPAEEPGLLERGWSALKDTFSAPSGEPVDVRPHPGEKAPVAAKPDSAMAAYQGEQSARQTPANAQTRAFVQQQYDAHPEKREAMLSRPDWLGDIARQIDAEYRAMNPAEALAPFDQRREAKLARNRAQGMDPATAEMTTASQMIGGEAPVGSIKASDFDFDLKQRYEGANPALRGAVKGYEGYKQGVLGFLQAGADLAGADFASGQFRQGAREAAGQAAAIGEGEAGARLFEGAVASLTQQLPLLIGGSIAGGQALILSGMAAQAFGQEYSEGRQAGLDGQDAAARASLFAAFEVIGEKFGLGNQLAALRMAYKGVPTKQLVAELGAALAKEIPGEVLTTTGQFLTDKAPQVGLNPEAGMAQYLSQVADTIGQTIIQGGLMMGGASAVSRGARAMQRPELDLTAGLQFDPGVNDALARQALDPSNAQETANVAPPLDATSYQGPGADPAGGSGLASDGGVGGAGTGIATGATARSGEPGVSVGEAERQQVAGVVEQKIAEKEAEAAATGDPIELLVTRAEGAAMRRAVTPQPANGIDIDQDALLADVEAMFTDGGNLMVQGDHAREAVKRIDPKALASALPRGDGALLVPKRFAGPVMDALQGAKQRVSVAFGGDGMIQAPDVAQFRATVPTQEEVQDVPKAQSLATQAQEAGGQEGAAAIELGKPVSISWQSGKFSFNETRTYEMRDDDGRLSRTSIDEDGVQRKDWLILKEDGSELWATEAGNKDDYVQLTAEQALQRAQDDLPAGALTQAPRAEGFASAGDINRQRRNAWRELGREVATVLPASASRLRPQPRDFIDAASELGVSPGDAALAWSVFSSDDTPTPKRDAPSQERGTQAQEGATVEQDRRTETGNSWRRGWFYLGRDVSFALPVAASTARPQPRDFSVAAKKLGISNADAARAWNVYMYDDTPGPNREAPTRGREGAGSESAGAEGAASGWQNDFALNGVGIRQELSRRGKLPDLYRAAGVRNADSFNGLSVDAQNRAFRALVAAGEQPIKTPAESYNDKVRREERDIEVRRLQGDDRVRQSNGKPFKSAESAEQFRKDFDLTDTHTAQQTEGGFELRRMSPASRAEAKRIAEGRESYMEARDAVLREMGIGEDADGEIDATDAQWDEIDRRVEARMRGAQPTQAPTAPEQSRPAQSPRSESAQPDIPPDTITPNLAPAQTQAADKPKRQPPARKPDPVTVDRAQRNAEDLRAMAQDAGWAEEGGKLIRDAEGKASRTKWIPRAEWFMTGMEARPDVLAQHIEAAARGEWIPVKSARTIEGMVEWLDAQRGQATLDEDASMYDFEASFGDVLDVPDAREVAEFFDDAFGDFAEQSEADAMRAMGFTEEEIANAGGQTEAGAGSAGTTDARGSAEAGERADEAGAAQTQAGTAGQQEGLTLDTYTPADIAQREAEQTARAEADARAEREAAAKQRQAEERAEVRRRSEAAADTFELGMDPMANLTGQGGLNFSRARMTDAERRATFPSATADVADADVIVVFNGTEMLNAPAPANAPKRFTRSTLVQSISSRFPSLTRAVESALRRGDEGKPGGVVVVEDAAKMAEVFAQKTGRSMEEARKSLQASIRAWHGSPHRFDRFSTQNIGTGEGAQAYGYGLYFADSREVAEHYRMMGAQVSVRPVDGQKLEVMAGPRGGEMKSVGTYGADEAFRVMKQQQAKFGALYEVSIAPAEDTFLLWDKPLSEQSAKVRKALEGFGGATTLDDVLAGKPIPDLLAWVDGFDRNNSFDEMVDEDPSLTADDVREAIKASYDPEEMADYLGSDGFAGGRTGESIYREVSSKGGGDQSASKALADAGVRGIKYLDGQSRDSKGDSFNYVVFDDADVEIVDVKFSQNGGINGFFDPRSGLTFLVAPNLTAETAPAVLLHEATHGKQRAEIDRKAMNLIENRQTRAKPLRDFLFRVEQRMDAAGESGNASEAAAYIVEEAVVAGRQAGFSAVDGKLMNWIDLKFGRRVSDIVRDFVAMIRAWAMRAGVELNPTVDDLVAIAKLNVRDMARGDVTGGEGTKESRASQTKSKAFRDWLGDSKVKKIVYHATAADFSEFNTELGDLGAHFGSIEQANYLKNRLAGRGAMQIMPVWLSLQNPLRLKDVGSFHADGIAVQLEKKGLLPKGEGRRIEKEIEKDWRLRKKYDPLVRQAIIDAGYDGVVYKNTHEGSGDSYIAFRPSQIKSALGNNGNFDPTDRRINFSRAGQATMGTPATAAQPAQAAPRAAQAQATPPDETRFQAFQRKAQDKLNRFTVIKEWLAEQGVVLSEQADVYKAEERMHSRFANKAEDFREKTVKPLIEKIQRADYSMDDVAQYLHAQHAEERNIQVASINKQMPDGGSGMKTADANAILAAAPVELKRLANEFRAITERTKQILLDNGIISQDMADAWEATYQHYVPLKGGPEQGGKGAGKGLKANYKGKRALGHTLREEGEWIVENILADHERAIMLAEKNRVGQSLLKMAVEVGRDDLLTVGKPEKRGVLKNNTAYEVLFKGKVIGALQSLEAARTFRATAPAAMKGASPSEFGIRKVSDPTVAYMASPMLAENEVNVYVRGQAIRVQINDELLARAYGNMGVEALGAILRVGATINGYFSKIYTGYNPEFILTNIVRDFTTGVANVTGEEGAMMALRAAKDYPSSFADLFRYATTGNASQWIRMYREDGGNTGAAYLSDLERLGDEISTEYAAYKGVLANLKAGDVKSAARAAGRKAFDKTLVWVERINQAGENAMRLSIYKAMIESGKSRAEAASLAKNATVNFSRNGEVGRQMNALWLFYNAGVQGTAAIAHANLKGRHKWQARAVSAGILGLGYTMAVALGAGDDEDDYDKLSDYTKARSVVIKTGDGWLKIPVPYGYGFFWNMGRAIADAERKGEWGKAPWHVASSFIEEFTPFGAAFAGDDLALEQVTLGALPTLAQIPASVGMNRTTMGGPMYPESAFDKYQPDNEKMWRATKGTIPDMIAQALDQGGIEVSPETIKYLTRTFTGGAGQFVTSIGDAAWLTANGASLEVKEQPFVRKFYTETDVREARSAYYAAVAEAEKAVREGKSILKMGDHAAYGAYRVENQEFYALDRMAKARAAAIKARRNYADAIRADKSLSVKEKRDKLKAAEAQEQVIYDRYLEVFKSRTRQ